MATVTKPILKDETYAAKMDLLIGCFSGHTLTIHASASDSTAFSGQEVRIKEATTGVIAATVYVNSTTDTAVTLPNGFNYVLQPVCTLANKYCDDTPSGILTANTTVNLVYHDIGDVTTFTAIKAALNAGLGSRIPIGQQVTLVHSTYGNIVFDVVDYQEDGETITLLAHNVLLNDFQFDAPEATYGAKTAALPAGNYSFVHSNTTYYFTTTVEVPVNGQIVLKTTSFNSYSSGSSITPLENGAVSTTSIAGAISLGTTGTTALNNMDKVNSGSSIYSESAIHQWLNSYATAGNWWTPMTRFDRINSQATAIDGFMAGIAQNVIDVVDTSVVACYANGYVSPDSTMQPNSKYNCNAKFFLAGQGEVYGTGSEGSACFDAFINTGNSAKIKKYNNSARHWWLRSPISTNYEYYVYTDGSLNNYYANYSSGVVPACKISKSTI